MKEYILNAIVNFVFDDEVDRVMKFDGDVYLFFLRDGGAGERSCDELRFWDRLFTHPES